MPRRCAPSRAVCISVTGASGKLDSLSRFEMRCRSTSGTRSRSPVTTIRQNCGVSLQDPLPAGAVGRLLIVDYAEARPDVLSRLAQAALELRATAGPRLRILALARTADEWWDTVRQERGMDLFHGAPFDMSASGAPLSLVDRRALFQATYERYTMLLASVGLAQPHDVEPPLERACL